MPDDPTTPQTEAEELLIPNVDVVANLDMLDERRTKRYYVNEDGTDDSMFVDVPEPRSVNGKTRYGRARVILGHL